MPSKKPIHSKPKRLMPPEKIEEILIKDSEPKIRKELKKPEQFPIKYEAALRKARIIGIRATMAWQIYKGLHLSFFEALELEMDRLRFAEELRGKKLEEKARQNLAKWGINH